MDLYLLVRNLINLFGFNLSNLFYNRHIIKVLHFIKNTINLLIFLPKNIDRRV